MPAPIDEIVKRKVVQQWLAGETREKIITDNDISAGTVSMLNWGLIISISIHSRN